MLQDCVPYGAAIVEPDVRQAVPTAQVTLHNTRDAVIQVYQERKNLAATLKDTKDRHRPPGATSSASACTCASCSSTSSSSGCVALHPACMRQPRLPGALLLQTLAVHVPLNNWLHD